MAATRSQSLLKEAMMNETKEFLESRLEKTIDDPNAKIGERIHALLLLLRSRNAEEDNLLVIDCDEDQSPNDKELIEMEVATESIETEHGTVNQFQVPISDSEILRNIELREENSELENLECVVMNENLEQEWVQKNVKKRFEAVGDVERDQIMTSNTKTCCAHKVFAKMSQYETLGIKKKTKGFKSWRFKFKLRKQQRRKLRSSHQLNHRRNVMYKYICSSAKLMKKNKSFKTWPTLKDDCFREDDEVFEQIVMVNEWLQTSWVIQQVMRNKKIKFSKRWWFKYKYVEEGVKRLHNQLRYKCLLELEERFKIWSRRESWRKHKEVQQFMATKEEMEVGMKDYQKQQGDWACYHVWHRWKARCCFVRVISTMWAWLFGEEGFDIGKEMTRGGSGLKGNQWLRRLKTVVKKR